MDQRYVDWIASNVDGDDCFGTCAETTITMNAVFPELVRVRGHYHCPFWGPRAHWWLVDAAGNVVDPTAAQFPSKGRFEYVPWEDGAEEPCGRCANCGEECFRSRGGDGTVCSDTCAREYAAYVMS